MGLGTNVKQRGVYVEPFRGISEGKFLVMVGGHVDVVVVWKLSAVPKFESAVWKLSVTKLSVVDTGLVN
jgi:hypothetical protein